jgi:acetolactate synthase I/II/III large subunit
MLTRRCAQRSAKSARAFSTTLPNAALSPYRKANQAAATAASEPTKRPQSTIATATRDRPLPSPAFNRDDSRLREPQPLKPAKAPQLDHSFVGMNGGQIFHEMMLRHDVKHICTFNSPPAIKYSRSRFISWLPWRRHPPRLRRHIQLAAVWVYSP